MGDLLGNLLDNMTKRPSSQTAQQKLIKKQEEAIRKVKEEEKKKLQNFRRLIIERIEQFNDDESLTSLKLEPMDKVHRAIVCDVADSKGLTVYSFGLEDIDRHCVLYKSDFLPSEEEITALKKGKEYDPEKARLMKAVQQQEERESMVKNKINPVSNYKDKYEHLIGKDAGKQAAQITTPNQQFGFVPSSLKRDQRSIEQTLNDIRKKKQKKEI